MQKQSKCSGVWRDRNFFAVFYVLAGMLGGRVLHYHFATQAMTTAGCPIWNTQAASGSMAGKGEDRRISGGFSSPWTRSSTSSVNVTSSAQVRNRCVTSPNCKKTRNYRGQQATNGLFGKYVCHEVFLSISNERVFSRMCMRQVTPDGWELGHQCCGSLMLRLFGHC